ncbi:thioredoxin-disulfide reductase [Geosporobacter ferrireducens]|uniref:Thioredoxin-disulfide reductase n=1 Tax=Geosporobacter ferrireducens TaxID=1424294 RepID=A0A1D8GQI5_9FIRM|nr:thioredoxin-disulfide reductase [Geosporobacter ferrireducens]MTI57635.1 FAD-dependent oxidoreductase [Geosporobacter ferrireducens]
MYDILIVGGGPAGMTAALYGSRANKSVCIIEKGAFGGQITSSPRVENWPGTVQMSGSDFGNQMAEQILAAGVDVEIETVIDIRNEGAYKVVVTEDGGYHKGRAVIVATGVKHRRLCLPGEEQLIGNGVYFCAVCDGAYYKDKSVAIIGGGNSALQEAVLLSEICSKVFVIQNLPEFTGEMKLREAVMGKPNVSVKFGTVVERYITEGNKLCGLQLVESAYGVKSEISCDGVFLAVGLKPENEVFAELAELNDYGYFASGEDCLTRTPGFFVAGDCRSKNVRQLTTAVADGAVAALAACSYIDGF